MKAEEVETELMEGELVEAELMEVELVKTELEAGLRYRLGNQQEGFHLYSAEEEEVVKEM